MDWMLPCGAPPLSGLPAPAGSDAVSAGILKITQCHQPLPVGASGSYTVTAKLFVPFGAWSHRNSGEVLLPLQPNPLNTWSLPMVLLSFTVGLLSRKSAAAAMPGSTSIAKNTLHDRRITSPLLSSRASNGECPMVDAQPYLFALLIGSDQTGFAQDVALHGLFELRLRRLLQIRQDRI